MKKLSKLLLLLSFLFASSAQAIVLTFDDIPGGSIQDSVGDLNAPYQGFTFSSTLDSIDVVGVPWWNFGAKSGDFAILNNYGGVGSITKTDLSDFSFDGLWAKQWATAPESGGSAGLFGTIKGFNNGLEVWSINTALNGSYQYFAGQSQMIDDLQLGFGNYFLVDDIALNQSSNNVPEPSTLLLLSLGFLGLGIAKSRRSI